MELTYPQQHNLLMFGIIQQLLKLLRILFQIAIYLPNGNAQNSGNSCLDCAAGTPGSVEEYVYQSAPVNLPGVPPAAGWSFTWDLCCRNGAITNLVLSSTTSPSEGFTLRATMFPYIDPISGLPVDGDPCFDSSPLFNEEPKTIICTGYPFSYSHNASDPELDSIVYSWDEPLDDAVAFGVFNPPIDPSPIPFLAPYSFNSPLPGNPILDANTGEISYNSNVSGNFVTVVRVDAFKCGQKVASIYREIQAVLIGCPAMSNGQPNSPPTITPPNGPQNWTTIINPSSGLPSYSTTVNAGELVIFDVIGQDLDIYANNVPQDVEMTISGGQMAADYITDTLCNNPPCATFTDNNSNPPPISSPSLVQGQFQWQTDCNQILSDAGCGNTTNVFNFLIKVQDDFCPANAITIATLSITILPALVQPAPDFQCVTENLNGDVTLTWDHLLGANNSTTYQIFGASNLGGPYTQLDDVSYPADLVTIPNANLPTGTQYYFMTLNSLCADQSEPSDTMIPINYSLTSSNVNCYNGNDGRIVVDMQTNLINPFYYYLNGVLNTNPVDSVFDNLSAGVYTVALTDNMNCYIEEEVVISVPGNPLQVLTIDTINTCHSDSSAFAVAVGIGGTPFANGTYLYNWYDSNVGSTNPTISTNDTAFNLYTGTYFVRITDANGCDTNASVQIISPQLPLSSSNQIGPIVCKGDSSGYIVGDAGGGFPPYTYTWSTSLGGIIQQSFGLNNKDTLKNISTGVYLLDIVDQRGCQSSQISITVNEPLHPLVIDTVMLVDAIDCFGDSTGRAVVYFSGGDPSGIAPAYQYLWDNGETDSLAQHLYSGYRSVTVTDGRGCQVIDSVFVPESTEIISILTIDSTVNCYGSNNGIVSVTTSGGYPNYIYSWSNGQPLGSGNVDTAFNLSYGSYALTTEDSWGCSVVDSVFMTEPDLLTMEAIELEWISCKDSADGLAFAVAQGGTIPYTFSWGGNQIGDTVNTLSPGVHLVTVTDAKGCTASDTVEIHEPPYLVVSISNVVPVYCNGVNTGSLTATASGGTPGYTYLWDDNPALPQITATASYLESGIYTVTATDSRGCIATATEDISQVVPTMQLDTSFTNVSCHGNNDGSALVIASGGHAPYTYTWVGTNSSFVSYTSSISGLSAGTYSVTVTDTNNCTRNSSVDIYEPLPIIYNVSTSVDELCLGACNGEIHIDSITGGTPPYVGMLTSNTTGAITYLTMSGDSIINGVCAGDYTVMVTDSGLCSSSMLPSGNSQAVVNSTVSALTDPQIVITDNVDCFGGSTGEIQITNPDIDYMYVWRDINGSYINSGVSVNNLTAGQYFVNAEYQNLGNAIAPPYNIGPSDSSTAPGGYNDGNWFLELDCTSPSKIISSLVYARDTNTITFELRDNLALVLDDTTITVYPGAQRIHLDFDVPVANALQLGISAPGSGLYRNRQPFGSSMPFPYLGSTINIVGTGQNSERNYYFFYDIEVQEITSNSVPGCISYSDTVTIVEPDPLSVSGVVNASDCFGGSSGSISISVTGGTSNYTYQWDNGSTLSQLNNLSSGDYTVTITDANSCVLVDTFTVTQPSPINVSISRGSNNANNPAYFELSVNGSSASGGTAPYVYTWKREYPVGVFTNVGGGNNYTVYAAGTYSVTVVDANGCTVASNDFTYNNPPTSVVENSGVIKLEIYPNPFNDVAIVDFGRYISNSQLKIFNIVGELVDEYEVRDTDKIEIERKEKVNGVYFAEIEIDDKKIFKKIIIVK